MSLRFAITAYGETWLTGCCGDRHLLDELHRLGCPLVFRRGDAITLCVPARKLRLVERIVRLDRPRVS
jgi:hypothetical protein